MPQMEHSYKTHSPGLRDYQGRGGRKCEQKEVGEDKTMSSGHDRTDTLMNLATVVATLFQNIPFYF